MRIVWVVFIFVLVGVAAALLRSRQVATQADHYRLEAERLSVRRRLWEQQLRMGQLRTPREIQLRREDWALDLLPPGASSEDHIVRRDR